MSQPQKSNNILVVDDKPENLTILDSIENTIVTVDDNMQVINANRPLDETCHLAQDDEGAFPDRLKSGSGPCADALRQTISSRVPVKELRVKCSCEGETDRTLVLNTAPLVRRHNELGGAVLVIRDITRLVQLEKSLQEKHSFKSIIGRSEKHRQVSPLLPVNPLFRSIWGIDRSPR